MNANQLNLLFLKTDNFDNDDETENHSSECIHLNNVVEEYVEVTCSNFLSFSKKYESGLNIVCINMRSIVNPSNFCKLEAFLNCLHCKPDIISISET